MKKRRPYVKNYSPSQRYPRTLECFPIRTKNIQDSKGRNLKRSHISKLQQNNEQFDNTSCLKKDKFDSLESLFDVKKPLNLRDAYPLAFDYYKNRAIKAKFIEFDVKSEPLVETLFLQSFSSCHNLESRIFELKNVKNEVAVNEGLRSKISNSALGLQRNGLEYNHKNYTINMAEDEIEVLEEQREEDQKEIDQKEIDQKEIDQKEIDQKEIDQKEIDQKEIDQKEIDEDQKKEAEPITVNVAATIEDIAKDIREDEKDEVEDKFEVKDIEIEETGENGDKDIEDKIEDEIDLGEKAPLILPHITEDLSKIKKKASFLNAEVIELCGDVYTLLKKPDKTIEEKQSLQNKIDILKLKYEDIVMLLEKWQRLLLQVTTFFDSLQDSVAIAEREKIEEEVEKEKKDIEIPKEKDFFDLPQIKYPEDKLPRVIICGSSEMDLPKIVVADSMRKGTEKCFEKLTGKLTESLTMQEKLVKENAQLEGGKYRLEEALLAKDTAIECLEKKVCGLQTEMRMIVKENTELSRQLIALSELVASPISECTSTSARQSSPLTTPSLPSHSYKCGYKCSHRSRVTNISSTTAETVCAQPLTRLAGGGSKTKSAHLEEGKISQNVEMCTRSDIPAKISLPLEICPAELKDKLTTYGSSAKQLEQQLDNMECEVRNMQMELANVQRERQQLEQQRKLLKCTGPCASCSCCPPPSTTCGTPSALRSISPKGPVSPIKTQVTSQGVSAPTCTVSCTSTSPMGTSAYAHQQHLRDLREQYTRLQEDYKNKLCEVSVMRTDAEKMKQELRSAKEEKERMEIKMIDAQERLKLLEEEKGSFESHKEQLIEQEQALMVAKQRATEVQDELEELRTATQDLSVQLEDYRNKYLQAQQQVEEQRRQIDLMEMDNARMNENVTLEIGRVKNQFQEKLAELAPLPEILKQTQTKLQDTQQIRLLAEHSCEDLTRELQGYKERFQIQQHELEMLRAQFQTTFDEREQGSGRYEELERKYSEMRNENEKIKNTLIRLEEQKTQMQKRMEEKIHENTQLLTQLEELRTDSARQITKAKDRCDKMRWKMQYQIDEMERDLAQCRATVRATQRDRDEIRQKMQSQINNLNESFEQAQGRIRCLQGHLNYLKTSSNILIGDREVPTSVPAGDAPGMGHDTCDCNY